MINMIAFDRVSKRYIVGSGADGLRGAVSRLPRSLLSWGHSDAAPGTHLWALRDVDFRVHAGEALGIVGRNGAGKTTILKLLSGITKATSGRVTVAGRVAALIELGAGFHPDLTGLENIYLYGTILGLRRREIAARLDRIVDFAELHAFMDTPVKRYSSGMYARLAFSVAAHVDPDVLLVDEVLAVGDARFQQKCFDFLHSFVRSGRLTVFISHSLYIEHLCDRLIWLDRGNVIESGASGRVLERYLSFLDDTSGTDEHADTPDGVGVDERDRFRVTRVQTYGPDGACRSIFAPGDDLTISLDFVSPRSLERPQFCVWVSESVSGDRPLFAANMLLDGQAPVRIEGRGSISCVFRHLPLMPRTFHVWVEVYGERGDLLFPWRRMASFRVIDSTLLGRSETQRGVSRFAKAHAPFRVAYDWLSPCGVK